MEFEKSHENEPTKVDTLYVIDLDRCLLDTRQAQRLLEGAAELSAHINADQMREARHEVEQSGGSFNTMKFLRDHASPQAVREITVMFMEHAKLANLFEPGAEELLRALDARGLPYMIMTYGGQEWQTMKLEASGLEAIPYTIVDVKEKGHVIAECWDEERQTYIVRHVNNMPGGFEAKHIVLIDDKLSAHFGLPLDTAQGIHVLPENDADIVPSQIEGGEVPANVRRVRGLGRAAQILFDNSHSIDKK